MDVNGFVKKSLSASVISSSVPSSVGVFEGPYKHWFERAVVGNLDDNQDNNVEDEMDIISVPDINDVLLQNSAPTLASASAMIKTAVAPGTATAAAVAAVTSTATAVASATVTPTGTATVTVTPTATAVAAVTGTATAVAAVTGAPTAVAAVTGTPTAVAPVTATPTPTAVADRKSVV